MLGGITATLQTFFTMTNLPFVIQVFIWLFSVGLIVCLILTNISTIFRIGRYEFVWGDMRVGLSWDQKKRLLYISPIPCVFFIYHLPKRQSNLMLVDPSGSDNKSHLESLEEGLAQRAIT